MLLYICVYLFLCVLVFVYICFSVCVSVYLFLRVCVFVSVCVNICLCVYLLVCVLMCVLHWLQFPGPPVGVAPCCVFVLHLSRIASDVKHLRGLTRSPISREQTGAALPVQLASLRFGSDERSCSSGRRAAGLGPGANRCSSPPNCPNGG